MVAHVLVFFIKTYQRTLSPDSGIFARAGLTRSACCFYPTCSEYAVLVITKHGAVKGVFRAVGRVFRCHPWAEPRVDIP